jgi:hydrogenase nickel incorporation protein HypA/HybF
MHELSIALALVEQAEAIARREGAAGMAGITVTVGELSGVNPEALELAFPVAAENSMASEARLIIETVAARARCRACGREGRPGFPFPACGHCGSLDLEISAGQELLIRTLELEIPDKGAGSPGPD